MLTIIITIICTLPSSLQRPANRLVWVTRFPSIHNNNNNMVMRNISRHRNSNNQ